MNHTRHANVALPFAVGTLWVCADRVVQIDGPLSLETVQVRDTATGALIPALVHDLKPLPPNGEGTDPLTVPEDEWKRSLTVAKIFEPYKECHALPSTVTRKLASVLGISRRQIQRLRVRFQLTHQTTSLVRNRGGRPLGLRLLKQEVEQVIQHVVAKHFACREPATTECIVERIRLLCMRLSLPPPSRGTILRRLRDREGFALERAQAGGKQARQHWEPRPGKHGAAKPLDEIQIDHTLVDLILVADDGSLIGRPWLTLAIDLATRVVLGFYLTMDPPSCISVAMCLAHAMVPKPEGREEPELWPMYGKPRCVHADNAQELQSYALKRGCEQHGITLRWRPIGKAHYGAHIERLMGTFMRMVHTLPGTTFSNVKARGDYPSERRACMTLEELRAWLVQRICRGYHVRRHRGLGMPPLVAWECAFRKPDGTLRLPDVPLRPEDLQRDFYPFEFRRMQRTGVQFNQSRYWDPALAPLVHPKRQVRVHYHPHDPSRVWVRTEKGGLIEAAAVAGAALEEGVRSPLSTEEQARLDAIKQAGYDVGDPIVAQARARRRTGMGKRKDRAMGDQARSAGLASSARPPAPPLSRASVTVEWSRP